mmetsp:Transcript_78301/g.162657  ORF Transcript_78301/g.162657 Transcript_78301/m.162657 type:complete len:499 (+) Transcript_78301:121-1617(+)|eukprot:CAMPEP_0206503860 /NCGR_PEP_ID=MMETSP0324_2-20121206/55053_1 /ASSEMBLY_ACC=CAM_ASM_000836 /TAXON_ID=2866 /ORGANISM="Crypthecodinium cohnii, Strain Seligo" /LENGTH=498 /DNA_ID=CAMNT_0053992743 /DNA_START=78 /DNA_END=1574 /DNA_ORIENTATION=+
MTIGDAADGWTAEQILGGSAVQGCDMNDFVFLPAVQSLEPVAKFSGRFSKNISLKTAVVGSPSPSVTETDMAIALALNGGIGIIHKQQSIAAQAAMVKAVKSHQSAFNLSPSALGPQCTGREALQKMAKDKCSCIAVTDGGRVGGRLFGFVTKRDLDAHESTHGPAVLDQKLTSLMISSANLVYASEPITYREAQKMLCEKKVGKLPILNSEKELVALICKGDTRKFAQNALASRDPNLQLLVAAAVSVDEETEGDGLGWDRARALVDAGVDALLLETDSGVSDATLAFLKRLKAAYVTTDIICGRVSSVRVAQELCRDADGLLIGFPEDGSTIESGGVTAKPNASAIYQIARCARMNGIPAIAEGGVDSLVNFGKAFALGAACAAPGPLLARTQESPGEVVYRNGQRVKIRERKSWRTPGEGVVVDKGSVEDFLPCLIESVKLGLAALGLKNLAEVHPSLASGSLRFELKRPKVAQTELEGGLQVRRLATHPLFDRW